MPKIQVNDISMYYEIHGQGEAIVCIAGFGADHLSWIPIVEFLKNHYQLILLDNRGAGQTDAPNGPYSISQMAADVAALCEKLNIEKAHFIANSMGGFILQTLAYEHAKLVKSAVISNSATNADYVFNIYLSAQQKLLEADAPLTAVVQAVCSWLYSYRFLTSPSMLDQIIKLSLENPYPFSLMGYEGQFAALANFDSSSWINKINTPTLVIGSDQDIIFNEATSHLLAKKIPQATYQSFKQCGHLPMIEFPEQFAGAVKNFIEEASSPDECCSHPG